MPSGSSGTRESQAHPIRTRCPALLAEMPADLGCVTWMTTLRGWFPTGGGLRDDDWTRRHRLLLLMLASGLPLLTVCGVLVGDTDRSWLVMVLLVVACVVGAVRTRGKRMASMLVALGMVAACAGWVALSGGLVEAHFTFFIAIAALALYRDWAPFGVFLVATVLHHVVFGTLVTDQHHVHAYGHPLFWAAVHGVAVMCAAGFQVVGWRLTEAEERRAQENLQESQAQLSVAFDETPVPMAMLTPEGRLLRTNIAYRNWLGLPEDLPEGFSVDDLPITPVTATDPLFDKLVDPLDPVVLTREYRRHDDGSRIWVEVHSTGLRDASGTLRVIFVHCLDITRKRRHAEELRHQVRHDALTGLLSRQAFEEDLDALMTTSENPVSVLYLDVDRFKAINDGTGHGSGDDVLRAIAERIAMTVPTGTLVARLGGDEFVVALDCQVADSEFVGLEILGALREPMTAGEGQLQISVSAGLAVAADRRPADDGHAGSGTAEDLVQNADTAMYAAKRAGGDRLEVFSEMLRTAVRDRIVAEHRLREALAGDLVTTLPVYFQPIVAAETSDVIGAEALVRMRTPDGTILSPFHFIGAAEETGLIVPLGEHVLHQAVRHLLLWQDELRYVSVNVSPRQLNEPDFVPGLAALLARTPDLDPSRLVLEITETALLGFSVDVRQRLEMLKALGVRIALDDFGTGYSSLTWLQSIPADVVKLDRSFVAGLAHDARKSSIISAVLWLARSLGMTVVAEGVEDPADWHALQEADCPAIQGFLFGKPVDPAEFSKTHFALSRTQ